MYYREGVHSECDFVIIAVLSVLWFYVLQRRCTQWMWLCNNCSNFQYFGFMYYREGVHCECDFVIIAVLSVLWFYVLQRRCTRWMWRPGTSQAVGPTPTSSWPSSVTVATRGRGNWPSQKHTWTSLRKTRYCSTSALLIFAIQIFIFIEPFSVWETKLYLCKQNGFRPLSNLAWPEFQPVYHSIFFSFFYATLTH